jgi:hypothetical protein
MQTLMRSFGLMALILAGISVNAQTVQEIKVEVPFTFTAAGKDLPPGEYHLFLNPLNAIVTLRGDNSAAVFLMTAPASSAENGRSFLRFYGYGERRTLQDVAFTGVTRRLASAHRNKLVTADPAVTGDRAVSTVTKGSLVTLTAEGNQN